jgi:hypothetical protein
MIRILYQTLFDKGFFLPLAQRTGMHMVEQMKQVASGMVLNEYNGLIK